MANKLIVEFLNQWMRDKALRCKVLHKENTELGLWGLDVEQRAALKSFDETKIVDQILKEFALLGIDLDELRKAIYGLVAGGGGPAGGLSTASYDEGKTHIRRVEPGVVTLNTQTDVVLLGQGFKDVSGKITVECRRPMKTVAGAVQSVSCGVDVWQRVTVRVTLDEVGDWEVLAHNDDDLDGAGNPVWSNPSGTIHVI